MKSTRSKKRVKEKIEVKFSATNREIRRARGDKNEYYEQISEEARRAAERGEMSKINKITKYLNGRKRRRNNNIRDEDRVIIQEHKQVIERWKEHFVEVLIVMCVMLILD